MGNRETTVLVLLDAFRWDYLDAQNTPSLWSMRGRGRYVRRLRPSLGFCERTELLTGAYPVTTGNFTAIGYDPSGSPFQRLHPLLRLLTPLDQRCRVRSVLRRVLTHTLRRLGIRMPIFQIPFDQLRFFALTEDRRDHFDAQAFAVESLVDVMRANGRRAYAGAFTALGKPNGDDENRIRLTLTHISAEYDLYLIYLGEPDRVGHRYGPDSTQRPAMTRQIDAQIRRLQDAFGSHFDAVHWVILGDHGMVQVNRQVDAGAVLHAAARRHGLRLGRDYHVFLDSTMVRVWTLDPQVTQLFAQVFTGPPLAGVGQLMTRSLADKLHIPPPGKRYGDLIWWCDPGVLVFPDYFHVAQPVKGMHGYEPGLPESQGMALVVSPRVSPSEVAQGELIDVCPTLCDLMNLHHPAQNQGTSFLER